MNVLIISDTHGWQDQLLQVIDRHKNEVDIMIHCGDSELPGDAKELEGVLTVQGNCDLAPFPEEIIHEVNGKVFYITHGHFFNVKHSLMNLMYRSEEVGADIVCFGHSHIFTSERSNGKLFINPGSLKNPRLVTTGTYAIYTLHDDGTEAVTYYDLQGNVMKEWSKTF